MQSLPEAPELLLKLYFQTIYAFPEQMGRVAAGGLRCSVLGGAHKIAGSPNGVPRVHADLHAAGCLVRGQLVGPLLPLFLLAVTIIASIAQLGGPEGNYDRDGPRDGRNCDGVGHKLGLPDSKADCPCFAGLPAVRFADLRHPGAPVVSLRFYCGWTQLVQVPCPTELIVSMVTTAKIAAVTIPIAITTNMIRNIFRIELR